MKREFVEGILLQSLGAAVAIAAMVSISGYEGMQLARVPFATSIMLVMAAPDTEFAQPRNVVGGHIVCTLCGLAVASVVGTGVAATAAAFFLACLAMKATRTFHPPAGIDPVICCTASVGWGFLVSPVATGAAMLGLFALLWHRGVARAAWPKRWW
jgi:CBS-domain-containing membrane protein